MDFDFKSIFEAAGERLGGLYDTLRRQRRNRGLSELLRPVDPFNRSEVLAPLVGMAGVVLMLMLSGVAVGALATTIAALMALYFLLTQVFGYDISVTMPDDTGV
jgi:hypothetical protein